MTNWLAVCREARAEVASALAGLPTRLEREPTVGLGRGGDETTAIDAAAERAVVEVLRAAHAGGVDFRLVSEELGEEVFGDPGGPLRVVLDPIDGSLNAKRGLPFFSLSIAVANGPAMRDVFLGYVYDFGTGEEWSAERGAGAHLNGRLLDGPGPKDEVELLVFEATRTGPVAEQAAAVLGLARRLRIMGSLALSLCHLAAGRVDGVCSLRPVRSVDIAAAQLLIAERGLAIELPDDPPLAGALLDVEGRSRVVAAGTRAACSELAARLTTRPPPRR